MGLFDRVFKRPANVRLNISRKAFPVKASSTALSGLAKLVDPAFISRLEDSLKYRDFDATMEARKKWLGIYTGEDINSHLRSKFTTALLEEVKLAETNIVDRGIRRMSLTYKDVPEYTYGGDLPDEYRPVTRWLAFKNAERYNQDQAYFCLIGLMPGCRNRASIRLSHQVF